VVFFFSDVEVCPLLVELGGVVRVVRWSPRGRAYPVELRCVPADEDRFLFILSMSYGMCWPFVTCCLLWCTRQNVDNISHRIYPVIILVCCVTYEQNFRMLSLCFAVVDFSLLIVVFNIIVHSTMAEHKLINLALVSFVHMLHSRLR